MKLSSTLCLLITLSFIQFHCGAADWTLDDGDNTEVPGRKVDVKLDGQLVARFIYGEGQIKPFLHVFGEEGDQLTHWDAKQTYPHHRGIFIGWNKIQSDLGGPPDKAGNPVPKGTFDLWHFNNGGKMEVLKFDKLEGGKDSATIVAQIAWRGGNKDQSGSNLLLNETRTLVISRPAPKKTQVDATFELKPARDLTLGGDLQHSGVHFRGSSELLTRQNETAYVWEPPAPNNGGKALGKDFKYARLIFPIGKRWYTSTELNAPGNPVEELSTREYGRFGFFFTKALKKDETLSLRYRFLTELAENLKTPPGPKDSAATNAKFDPKKVVRASLGSEDDAVQRKEAQAEYERFLTDIKK